jgi:hypothetical protein
MGFRKWVVAFCSIRFDLEQGQVVEECYPAGALSPEEELDVAFNSFPDSMSQVCFFQFSGPALAFKISNCPYSIKISPEATRENSERANCPKFLHFSSPSQY